MSRLRSAAFYQGFTACWFASVRPCRSEGMLLAHRDELEHFSCAYTFWFTARRLGVSPVRQACAPGPDAAQIRVMGGDQNAKGESGMKNRSVRQIGLVVLGIFVVVGAPILAQLPTGTLTGRVTTSE